jgi:SAM-dependent methyltransferase
MSEPIANVDMANAWDGEEGDQWTQFADDYDASVRSIWGRFLATVPIARADRVLDIGCGSGQSTRDAARLARDGSALGVDLSGSMLAEARRRASVEGLTNVEFLRADAQVHAFDTASFDVVISRFGSMFFSDRRAAFANIASALRPGGRLALLVWQATARNEWIMVARESLAAGRALPMPAPGAPGPAALADPDDVEALLTGVGFEAVELTSFEEPLRGVRVRRRYWDRQRSVGRPRRRRPSGCTREAEGRAPIARNARRRSLRQRGLANHGPEILSRRVTGIASVGSANV